MSNLEPDDQVREQLEPDWAELVLDNLALDKTDPEEQNLENFDYSALNTLGTQAIARGLLIGHGYHQGQYELLLAATRTHPVTPLLLSPRQAYGYLKSLLNGETPHG
jgi:hypothetical protein